MTPLSSDARPPYWSGPIPRDSLQALRDSLKEAPFAHTMQAQAGNLAAMQRVLAQAVRARAPPNVRALRALALACEDGGLASAAAHFEVRVMPRPCAALWSATRCPAARSCFCRRLGRGLLGAPSRHCL